LSALFFYRCKKVYDGVTHAGKLYPNAYLIMILIGTLKGWSLNTYVSDGIYITLIPQLKYVNLFYW